MHRKCVMIKGDAFETNLKIINDLFLSTHDNDYEPSQKHCELFDKLFKKEMEEINKKSSKYTQEEIFLSEICTLFELK